MVSGGDVANTDSLGRAGQSILRLLQKAGDATDQDRRYALEMAQRLSQELRVKEATDACPPVTGLAPRTTGRVETPERD
jgi:hypothetical protein